MEKNRTRSIGAIATLPITYLIGHTSPRILVVGGGRAAYKKCGSLLKLDFKLDVIAAEFSSRFQSLTAQYPTEKLQLLVASIKKSDLQGYSLIILTTDDESLNRALQTAAAALGIPCSIASTKSWFLGDFIFPAVFKHDDLLFAISSSGSSCRLSMNLRKSLERSAKQYASFELICLGTDHRHINLTALEAIAPNSDLDSLIYLRPLHEFFLVQTCNRFELYAFVGESSTKFIEKLRGLLGLMRLGKDEYYFHRGAAAFNHLSMVLAGAYSQALAEKSIVHQVKKALKEADSAYELSKNLLDNCLHAARQLRKYLESILAQQGLPAAKNNELSDILLAYLAADFNLENANILLLGSGYIAQKMACRLEELATKSPHWASCKFSFSYRQNKAGMPASWRAYHMSALATALPRTNILISLLKNSTQIIDLELLRDSSPSSLLCLADLGMPRTIAPNVAPRFNLVNLEDLKNWRPSQSQALASKLSENMEQLLISNKIKKINGVSIHEQETYYQRFYAQFLGRNKSQSVSPNSDQAEHS